MRGEGCKGMLYVDDAEIVSKSAEGLAKMMTVILGVFRTSRLHGIGKIARTASTNTRPDKPSPPMSSSKLQARDINRRPSSYTEAALSAKTLVARAIGSVSCGHASNGWARRCMIGRPPRLA